MRHTANQWITDFLATELAKNKLHKLAKADTAERHLAVLIYPDTEAGSGIAVTDELPSVVPSAPLTHLWLIAPTDPPRALRWTHITGWAVVHLPAGQHQTDLYGYRESGEAGAPGLEPGSHPSCAVALSFELCAGLHLVQPPAVGRG
jgi:hypothetical protein